MMNSILLRLFTKPKQAIDLTNTEWTHVLTHGRNQNMLGRLYAKLKSAGLSEQLPQNVITHMTNCEKTEQRQRINIDRELKEISNALSEKHVSGVVLKGAAYSLLELRCADGRIFNDIDVLVAHSDLRKAEIGLMTKSWFHTKENDYDKRYFREWMHEIPPMVHKVRHTTIDLHHNILPLTNRQHFSSDLLKREKTQYDGLYVLTTVDRFIHSAVHLFTESEFPHAIRDLTDLILLFEDVEASLESTSTTAEQVILLRSDELNLNNYIQLAIYFVLFHKEKAKSSSIKALLCKSAVTRLLTLPSYQIVFDQDCAVPTKLSHKLALLWLMIRSHLIKMPLRILIPHLVRKFIFNTKKRFSDEEKQHLQ